MFSKSKCINYITFQKSKVIYFDILITQILKNTWINESIKYQNACKFNKLKVMMNILSQLITFCLLACIRFIISFCMFYSDYNIF